MNCYNLHALFLKIYIVKLDLEQNQMILIVLKKKKYIHQHFENCKKFLNENPHDYPRAFKN